MPYPIYIKNMVCDRCKSSVEDILNDLEISFNEIKLGEVNLKELPETEKKKELSKKLQQAGFELLEDRDSRLINKINRVCAKCKRLYGPYLKRPLKRTPQ